jgi:hypothetical protein
MGDGSVGRPHAHPELGVGVEPASAATPERADGRLLGIGLAIYFVVLIGIVAVMLILPALMPAT